MQKDGALLHGRVGALLTAGTSDSKSLSLLSSYMYSVVSIVTPMFNLSYEDKWR